MPPIKSATMLALLAFASAACQQRLTPPATASDTSQTSLCLVDRPIPASIAPAEGQDDPGNRFDSDATVDRLMEHNASLRAACPEGEAR